MSRVASLTVILAILTFVSTTGVRAEEKAPGYSRQVTPTPSAQAPQAPSAAAKPADAAKPTLDPAKEAAQNAAQTAAPQNEPVPSGEAAAKAPGSDQASLHPRVKIETTLGSIVLELDAEKAPITVRNFLRYAQDGFYDGTVFHRVISDFMIQGGGFTIDMEKKKQGVREPIKNEWSNGLGNKRGTIAMARVGGQADSATTEFFINVADNSRLDQPMDGAGYAVFGHVVEGMDTVDKIKDTKVFRHPKYSSQEPVTPAIPVVIKSVKVVSAVEAAAVETKAKQSAEESTKLASPVDAARQDKLREVTQRIEKETGHPVVKTQSGLLYSIIKEGTGPSPKPTDTVEVQYRGTLLDGTPFDSSYERGQPASFRLNEVIKGWTEGVGLMKVGEKRYLIVPPELGYGARKVSIIPPNSTLVFEVELLGIK